MEDPRSFDNAWMRLVWQAEDTWQRARDEQDCRTAWCLAYEYVEMLFRALCLKSGLTPPNKLNLLMTSDLLGWPDGEEQVPFRRLAACDRHLNLGWKPNESELSSIFRDVGTVRAAVRVKLGIDDPAGSPVRKLPPTIDLRCLACGFSERRQDAGAENPDHRDSVVTFMRRGLVKCPKCKSQDLTVFVGGRPAL
jgi:Zn ribbon nucleic-acid-binding protein